MSSGVCLCERKIAEGDRERVCEKDREIVGREIERGEKERVRERVGVFVCGGGVISSNDNLCF